MKQGWVNTKSYQVVQPAVSNFAQVEMEVAFLLKDTMVTPPPLCRVVLSAPRAG